MEKYKSIIIATILSVSGILIASIFTFLSPQSPKEICKPELQSTGRFSLFQGTYTVRYSSDKLYERDGIILLDSETGKTSFLGYSLFDRKAYYGWLPLEEVNRNESLYLVDGIK